MRKTFDGITDKELSELFPIIILEHNPIWKNRYEKEKKIIMDTIGDMNIERISHIGSTVVQGLLAKPTIDILVEIKDDVDTQELIYNMTQNDYHYLKQPKNPPPHMIFLKGYTPKGFSGQAFHIHIRYNDDWKELYFRDYLIKYKKAADEYGMLKLKLMKEYEYDRDGYTEAKTEFITKITKLARNEMKDRYKPTK